MPLEQRDSEAVVELDTLGLAEVLMSLERMAEGVAEMEGSAEAAGVVLIEPVEMTDALLERVEEALLLVVAPVSLNHEPLMTIP